jgi:prolyl 4-hydroxylase
LPVLLAYHDNNMDVTTESNDDLLRVEQLSYQPNIFRVKGFLTDEECNHLMETSKNKLRPCNEISAGVNRTGWGVFLQKSDENHAIIQRILKRMAKFVPVNNESEVMQVIR